MTLVHLLFAWLAHAAEPWQHLYSHSTAVSVTVLFLHLGALLVAGGLALTADRDALRLLATDERGRQLHLESMKSTHGTVVSALALVLASGVLLFLSDVEVFSASPVFWIKLGLVTLLLVNGFVMTRVEAALHFTAPGAPGGQSRAAVLWSRRRATAMSSVALWFAVVFVGVVLTTR